MLIRVMYLDGRYDMVKPTVLDRLLEEQKLSRFLRASGWAVIGYDALRRGRAFIDYEGPERRAVWH